MARVPRPNDNIGARVRVHRERSGKSQAVVAGLAGISEDYLGQIERGRKVPSARVIQTLADALRIPAGVLLGDTSAATPAPAAGCGDRLALALLSGGGVATDLADLSERTSLAWRRWQSSDHRPRSATKYDRSERPTRRVTVRSNPYRSLATIRTAEDADNPIRLAVARWNLGHTLLISNEYEAAIELVANAAASVLAERGAEPAAIALAGALELVAAVAEARAGRLWEARDRLNRVHPVAVRSPNMTDIGHTMFSTTNVGLHAISIELQAGDALEALRIAEQLDTSEYLSVERRFTFALDLARAYELRRQETGTLLHLLNAEQISPEDLQYNSEAHDMVRRLLQGNRSPNRVQAAGLADRLSIPV
ncbi:helix-turn-helix domain-containing protein [Nocardia otitidiscaviarum]|nr:helix-turn-helix transcriptional regulator [Nocardia otitidiscaviarum]MCP9620700.1 helix-turn-helix domain-containing protein [Nocardia otitidiscaviarum]